MRLHNKLLFALCFKCANEKKSEECTHNENERIIRGTYIDDELRLAVLKGYTIIKIYEAWEYKIIQSWRRLGMREDKEKKVFVKNKNHLFGLMTNALLDINSFSELSLDALLVSYKMREKCTRIQPNVNVVLAAYTTAQARMHLYAYLDKLQDRCLYYDTDSVICTWKDGEDMLPLSDYLGELTDELSAFGPNSFISEAVFTAEKSYALIVKRPGCDDHTVCKVKGVCLNFINGEKINFKSLKNLVLGDQNETITIKNDVFLRDCSRTVYTTEQMYRLKVNADKRIKIGSEKIKTSPYSCTKQNL